MNNLIVIDLPPPHGEIKGCWYKGYPIHKGESEDSLNYATVYSQEHRIIPDQERIKSEHAAFIKTLQEAGFSVQVLPFPEELNQPSSLYHDGIFLRDAGFYYDNKWIKGRFSARGREQEADAHARQMSQHFNLEVVELPEGGFLEFGETFYLQTAKGSYYFGGISRSNEIAHDFVRTLLEPEHYCLLRSQGYHLDTVFTPVLNHENELCAFLIAKNMFKGESRKRLEAFEIPIIELDPIDSSGEGDWLGTYAVNGLIAPGKMLNSDYFQTPGVEEKLKELNIERYVSPLSDFRFAGGSYHCLTNEVYKTLS